MQRNGARLAAIFLLAMSVLMIEVCLTRILSVLSWHHFAYLIISLALLGFGAAGSYLTVSRKFREEADDSALLAKFAWLFAVTTAVTLMVATKIRFYPVEMRQDYSNGLSLLILYVLMGTPFFFAGVCIGRLIAQAGDAVNRFYFADLLGAGVGALLALAVLNVLGATGGVIAAGSAGALAAGILSRGRRRLFHGATCAALIALAILVAKTRALPLYYPPSKDLFGAEREVEYSRWNAIGKIDITRVRQGPWSFGGALSRRYKGADPRVHGIYQDGAAPTGIMVTDQPAEKIEILGEYLQGVAYTVGRPAKSLIIGVGGGIDGLIALHYGTRDVTGVDLNPITIDAIENRYRGKCPTLWRDGRFRAVVAEGRHYLTRSKDKFDVIQLSGVDTFTALSTGAYALSENFLYTVEAMEDYWEHLTDDGILSFSRWLFDPPRETLRLVNTQLAMMDDAKVAEPSKHVFILSGPARRNLSPWAETLLKKSPFTEAEVAALRTWAKERQFDVLYDPYQRRDNAFDAFCRAGPAERAKRTAAYRFKVNPTTDDDPFFFQFYRFKSLWEMAGGKGGLSGSKGGYGITRLPVGLIVLGLSMLQILVLSLVFILLPLLLRRTGGGRTRGRLGFFVYFAALGVGFMFIEIPLLQQFSVFVGGPVYSMAITLASILVFSGLGSLLAQKFRGRPGRWLALVVVALIGLTFAEIAFLNRILPQLLGLGLVARWVATALAICPLGLLMGMPFPTGLRILTRLAPDLRPWAWGINACATVLASMLCVLVSIEYGFTVSLMAATGIYAFGALGMLLAAAGRTGAADAA